MSGPATRRIPEIDVPDFADLAGNVDVVVLDVHGVVLNRPLTAFLTGLGVRTGEGGIALLRRWRDELRVPFWTGEIDDDELWALVAPGLDAQRLRSDLEERYAPGPLFELVRAWPGPMWLLSNHRTDWLTARLERFGLAGRFERILVSDALGAAKPDPAVFTGIVDESRRRTVCFVDDTPRNVAAAIDLGIDARLMSAR